MKKFESTTWTDEMSVGVNAIDNDHKKLLSLLNELDHIIFSDEPSNKAAIESVMSELIDYTIYHFDREEALMVVCEYPGFDKHKRAHEALKAQVNSFMDSYKQDPDSFEPKTIRIFLNLWLVDHIMTMDKDYESWMQGKDDIIEKFNTEFEDRKNC